MEEELTPKQNNKSLFRRLAPVLIAGLVIMSLGVGGVSGSAATIYWLSKRPAPLPTAMPTSAQVVTFASQTETDPAPTNIAAVYRAVSPAVVSITALTTSNRSRGTRPQAEAGGTGFIVNDQGYILTNNHVVQGASRVSITLLDGTTLEARVAGTDPGSDLALLQANIPSNKIVVAPLGDSDRVEPGQPAIAIGSPFGLDHTLTSGIVSAINREFGMASGRPMRGLIQTDAPINPGNSGGPLFNANGEVIGITTSIESPVQGSVGIGFAVPINRAKGLLPQLQSGQKVNHTYLGISGTAITPDLARAHNLPVESGILVVQVVPNSPADQAGLKGENPNNTGSITVDIITQVDGKAVKTVADISSYIDTKRVGESVILTVLRDGKTINVKVTLGAWPASTTVRNQGSGGF